MRTQAPGEIIPARYLLSHLQLFVLKDGFVHFWKIKKVGNGHIQSYGKAVQGSQGNILGFTRHNVLYGGMAYAR